MMRELLYMWKTQIAKLLKPRHTWYKNEENYTVSTVKLTDLPVECHETIFKYLPTNDLFNIADSSKQLQSAVKNVYHQRYPMQSAKITLNICHDIHHSNHTSYSIFKKIFSPKRKRSIAFRKYYQVNRYGIEIEDMKTSLQHLRHFGHLIRKLLIYCQKDVKNCDKLYEYINQYCSQHLHTAHIFFNIPENGLSTPFLKLRRLYFHQGIFDNDISQHGKFFPNLKLLHLGELKLTNPKCIATHFESIKILSLGYIMPKESLKAVIKLYPHLQCYSVHTAFSEKLGVVRNYLINHKQSKFIPDQINRHFMGSAYNQCRLVLFNESYMNVQDKSSNYNQTRTH